MVANAVGGEAVVKAEAAKRWPKASLYKGFATDNNRHSGQWGRDQWRRLCGSGAFRLYGPLSASGLREERLIRRECDRVSGLFDAALWPLAQMGSAIHTQTHRRP